VANPRSKENSQRRDRRPGGRPRKFGEPSQPITITLPQSTLRQLQQIDPDRGRAIVKLAKNAFRSEPGERPLVEIVDIAGNTGLVIVGPNETLKRIQFLRLVEVAPARYLIALAPERDFYDLEIALNDLVDDPAIKDERERALVTELLRHFRNLRRTDSVTMGQILFVRLKPNR
jgi:hypothetical protein